MQYVATELKMLIDMNSILSANIFYKSVFDRSGSIIDMREINKIMNWFAGRDACQGVSDEK